jgi:hypothetical protein
MTEAALHRSVAEYLTLAIQAPDFFTTFPAGGGGKARGGQLKARGMKAGCPDILIIKDGRAHWAELKTEQGKLSDAQVAAINQLGAAGCPVAVIRSVDAMQRALEHWGFNLKARAA